MVSEMSDHIYDGRKLEQSVLALLAFFNQASKPVLATTSTAVVAGSTWSTQTNLVPQPKQAREAMSAKRGLSKLAYKQRHKSK